MKITEILSNTKENKIIDLNYGKLIILPKYNKIIGITKAKYLKQK